MARLVVSSNFRLRMDWLSVSDLWSGPTPIADGSLVQRENDGLTTTEFRGSFLYDGITDELVGGDLFRIDQFYGEARAFFITGLYVDMGSFMDWADADDTDLALSVLFAGNDRIVGGRSTDYLEGFAGHDRLDGGRGRDSLVGGTGDDTYYVDHAREVVIEEYGEGNDRVYASRSYVLTADSSIEILSTSRTSSKTPIKLTGNGHDNIILGNAGRNVLRGGAGDDDLDGGKGHDVLYGGSGQDAFHFASRLSAARNVDRIADFQIGIDTIMLDGSIFGALPEGELSADAFRIGSAARDASDRIVYNPFSGALSYDADGVGGAPGIKFARLRKGMALDAEDFFVV